MSKQEKRLFDYTKLIKDVQKKSSKSQEMLSVNLECTAAHISNVKRQKSTFSVDKTLQLLNENDYCIDDYVTEESIVNENLKPEDRERFQGLDSDLRVALVNLVMDTVKVSRRKEEDPYLDLDHEWRKQKIAERIRRLRIEKNVSVETMCKNLNVKKTTYQNIENGSNGTTIENYVRIASVLQIPVSLLMSDVVKNKDTLIDYELNQLFSEVNFRAKKKLEEMIDSLIAVVSNYLE